ncbi:MAG: ribonuclease HII [Candidatus Omnitrophica bacterium]|nr:ribonuclease HII [Candidatus Omnitrophota bacterium]
MRRLKTPGRSLAGVDEAGRGPLAGPVVASAVILHRHSFQVPIDDSKRLSSPAREAAYRQILPRADIGVGWARVEEIDRLGIHAATHLAMVRALRALPLLPQSVLIDGPIVPEDCPVPAIPVVGGDGKSLRIACASIVAKVIRDRFMLQLHRLLPEFGFLRHKGYGTQEHLERLRAIGPSDFHRFSFRPVREAGGPW